MNREKINIKKIELEKIDIEIKDLEEKVVLLNDEINDSDRFVTSLRDVRENTQSFREFMLMEKISVIESLKSYRSILSGQILDLRNDLNEQKEV